MPLVHLDRRNFCGFVQPFSADLHLWPFIQLSVLTGVIWCILQGGDDEYQFSGDDFEDPYSPEELAQFASGVPTATAEAIPAEGEVPVTVFKTA